jgi:hypothetical protein
MVLKKDVAEAIWSNGKPDVLKGSAKMFEMSTCLKSADVIRLYMSGQLSSKDREPAAIHNR